MISWKHFVQQAVAQLSSARGFASCLAKPGNIPDDSRAQFARLGIQCFEFLIQSLELLFEIFIAHCVRFLTCVGITLIDVGSTQ